MGGGARTHSAQPFVPLVLFPVFVEANRPLFFEGFGIFCGTPGWKLGSTLEKHRSRPCLQTAAVAVMLQDCSLSRWNQVY